MPHHNIGLGTSLLHLDDEFSDAPVAPAIAVSTSQFYLALVTQLYDYLFAPSAYKASETETPWSEWDPLSPHTPVYSRYTQNVSTRVEKVIGALHVSPMLSL